MPTYDRLMDIGIVGDDIDSFHYITDVPVGQDIEEAWYTAKADAEDADGATGFQKHITTANVAGQGQITNGLTYTITVSAAAALDATQLTVRPLAIPLARGMRLAFSNGVTVTLKQDAEEDATSLIVRPISGSIAEGVTAPVSASLLFFEFTGANTNCDSGGLAVAEQPYVYDVQYKLSNGKIQTPEDGTLRGRKQKTKATS